MREQIAAMKEIWTKDKPEHHGEFVSFPPMMTWPKPSQKPHPPIIVGGAFRLAARRAIRYDDRILPAAPSAGSGSPEEFMPRLRQMAEKAGRDPQLVSVTLGGAPEDIDILKRNRDLSIARMTVRLPPAEADGAIVVTVLPITHSAPADRASAVEIPLPSDDRIRLEGNRGFVRICDGIKFQYNHRCRYIGRGGDFGVDARDLHCRYCDRS
jgi:alkanesulfonate monooxygenase SsuD/methylene tetrahydromethanopterin reductase-like flavin-dependent oxidoreductase (luciferase family)